MVFPHFPHCMTQSTFSVFPLESASLRLRPYLSALPFSCEALSALVVVISPSLSLRSGGLPIDPEQVQLALGTLTFKRGRGLCRSHAVTGPRGSMARPCLSVARQAHKRTRDIFLSSDYHLVCGVVFAHIPDLRGAYTTWVNDLLSIQLPCH